MTALGGRLAFWREVLAGSQVRQALHGTVHGTARVGRLGGPDERTCIGFAWIAGHGACCSRG